MRTGAHQFEARSSAVEALERAVAAGDRVAPAAAGGAVARGVADHVELAGDEYVVEFSEQAAVPQLAVAPITLIASEYSLRHYRQIAASQDYICYGLKQGHIRVLCRASPVRALLKGHALPVTDLQFCPAAAGSPQASLLASGGQDGRLCVWRLALSQDGESLQEESVLKAKFSAPGGVDQVLLSWRPDGTLVAGAGGRVLLLAPGQAPGAELAVSVSDAGQPGVAALPEWESEDVSSLTVSPDGQLLAAGGKAGTVRVWRLQPGSDISAAGTAWTGTVPARQAGKEVGCMRWLPADAPGDGWLLLVGSTSNAELELWHAQHGADGLAFARLQRLRLGGGGGATKQEPPFYHVEVVPSQQLVVLADTPHNAVAALHLAGVGRAARFDYVARFGVAVPILSFMALWNAEADPPAVELYCVQTTAIQQYSLDPAACRGVGLALPAAPAAAVAPEAEAAVAAPPPPQANGTEAVEEEEKEEEASAAGRSEGQLPEGQPPSPPAPTTDLLPPGSGTGVEEEEMEEESPPSPPPSTVGADLGAPGGLRDAEAAEPLPQAPSASLTPRSVEGSSGGMSPEICPSPPPTPHDTTTSHFNAAPLPGEVGGPSPPAADVPQPSMPPPPQALLTLSDDAELGQEASFGAALADSALPRLPAGAPPAPAPAPAAALDAAQLRAAVGAAVEEELAGVHRKFAGHVSLMYRELLKALKAEMGAQLSAAQQATAAALAQALAAQKQQVEAERASLLAEERANMQQLLTAISATLNHDLPQRLQEALRVEMAGVASSLASGVAPAVGQAVQASLPKEVTGAVRREVAAALPGALAASLDRPLQEAFVGAFGRQLLPAFEQATQAVFTQVNSALAAGLQEHAQASRAALAEPVQLAGQLREALASAKGLAGVLAQEQEQLLRAGSLAPKSPLVPRDARAELQRQLKAGQYEQAFTSALSLQDVGTVTWLCGQVEPGTVLGGKEPLLSQPVLLALAQQLSSDLGPPGLAAQLRWVQEAVLALDPSAPVVAAHVRPVLTQVLGALEAQLARVPPEDKPALKLCIAVVRSQLAG